MFKKYKLSSCTFGTLNSIRIFCTKEPLCALCTKRLNGTFGTVGTTGIFRTVCILGTLRTDDEPQEMNSGESSDLSLEASSDDGLVLSDANGKKLRFLGPITPLGGLLLVFGWSMLLYRFIF